MNRAPNQIIAKFVIGFLLMLTSGWKIFGYLKEGFQNVLQGNFNTPEVGWHWVVMAFLGMVMFIWAGVSWDRIKEDAAISSVK